MTTLAELGDAVEPPDLTAADATGWLRVPGATLPRGTLRDVAAWLASVRGAATTDPPRRVRVVRFGFSPGAQPPAAGADIGEVRDVDTAPVELGAAIELGVQVADDEIDRGADLLIAVVARAGVAAEIVVSTLTDAEPVKVLPRGTALTPPVWMARAEQVRDGRRRAMAFRDSVDALLGAVGDPALAAATAFLLRAAGRRTAVVVDGFGALAAALAASEQQSRSVRWYRIADSSGSPGEELAIARLGQRAVLDLGVGLDDGTAGLLAAVVVRFAVESAVPGAV